MLSLPDDKCLSSLSEKLTQGNSQKDGFGMLLYVTKRSKCIQARQLSVETG